MELKDKVGADMKRPEVSLCYKSGLNTTSFTGNPGTDRITFKLHFIFSEDGYAILKTKPADEEWPKQLEIGLCLQNSSIPVARPEQFQDRAMHGEFCVLTDTDTIVNVGIWFS